MWQNHMCRLLWHANLISYYVFISFHKCILVKICTCDTANIIKLAEQNLIADRCAPHVTRYYFHVVVAVWLIPEHSYGIVCHLAEMCMCLCAPAK